MNTTHTIVIIQVSQIKQTFFETILQKLLWIKPCSIGNRFPKRIPGDMYEKYIGITRFKKTLRNC